MTYGVFILTKIEGGRMDQAVREFNSIDTALGEIRDIITAGVHEWKAVTIIRGEDMPKMMEGGFPTPPDPPS